MRPYRLLLAFSSCLAAFVFVPACDDDYDVIVRERLDSGADAAGGEGTLPCGVAIPTSYESASFDANTKIERDLRERFETLDGTMQATEGESSATVTAAELNAIYNEGAPSLRAVSTSFTQATLEQYFDEYGESMGESWTPADADGDAGVESGGKYGAYYFSETGVALRQATAKTLLGGALYNHVLGIVQAPMTEASVDRLLAAFGATPALANLTDADAGAERDTLLAEYASNRDDPSSDVPGPYRKIRAALLTMKAALTAADQCQVELEEAVATYLREWERVSFASAIYYLNAATKDALDPTKGPSALHAFGEALGFIQGFKGLPADRRTIQDAQIDALVNKLGADTPYRLVTSPGERVPKLNEAIADIAVYQGFSAEEVESFKQSF